MRVGAAILLVSLPLVWACASSGAGGAGRQAARHNPSVISSEELQRANASNHFDVVRTMRPEWLMRRAPTVLLTAQEGNIVVYMDRARLGDPDVLRQISPSDVASLRFFTPSEAEAEFGVGHMHGAIQLLSRRH